jgi:zeaxanthin glucosyltransferase
MKIGFVSMPVAGHLNPMTALARRLQSRGHEVVFIGFPDVEPFARAAGLDFVPYCEKEFPAGSIAELYRPVSKLHGLEVTRWTTRERSGEIFRAASEHLPQKLAETGVKALVIDTIHSFLQLVPMSLGMPFAQVWNILHIDLSGATPPCFFSWPHETTPRALARNAEGVKTALEIFAPVRQVAVEYAGKVGLSIDWSNPTAIMSKLAVITQTPKEFDFPGIPWPAQFQYAGPLHDSEGRRRIPFPWEKLTSQRFIYASLGTLVNGMEYVYKTILQAVGKFPDIQVALSVGKNVHLNSVGPIPSNVIVVHTAPQLDLLKRAALCITHGGLNTVLESLGQGVPMVAIPIGFDQPGVAARIAHHGVGEFVEVENLTVDRLHGLIQKVLETPGYREKAHYFRRVITQARGLDMAADVLERAFGENEAAEPRGKQAETLQV